VHAYFPTEEVRIEGTTKVYARKGDSGAYVHFHFCPECGTTVYWKVEASPGKTGIAIGVFADPTFPARTFLSSRRINTRGSRFPRASLRTKGTVRPSRPLRLRAEVDRPAIPQRRAWPIASNWKVCSLATQIH
jgi:hypothetical protein